MPANQFSEEDGHALAADCLREIADHHEARRVELDVPDDTPDGEFDRLCVAWWKADRADVLRRYLATVATKQSPELERGFYAVLSNFLGEALSDAGAPDLEAYTAAEGIEGA